MSAIISATDFKAYFTREFSYGVDANNVRDADISRAIAEAAIVFNEALWGSAAEAKIAYEYLTAHFLVIALRNNGGLGVQKKGTFSTGGGAVNSKSAGPLSVSFTLSSMVTEYPQLSQMLETGFGQTYLTMLSPRLVGNIVAVEGMTQI